MKKLIVPVLTVGLLTLGTNSAFAYVIQKGDTLGNLAIKYDTTVEKLMELNPQIKDKDLIYYGTTLNTNVSTEDNTNNGNNISNNTNTNDTVNGNQGSQSGTQGTEQKPQTEVDSSEHDLLCRLVEAEAGAEPYIGKVAVASVVLNRVAVDSFPNSIKEVIYQTKQFTPVTSGTINNTPSADSRKAVDEALKGNNPVPNALFFYNPKTATSRWLDSRETVKVIGNHTFKK